MARVPFGAGGGLIKNLSDNSKHPTIICESVERLYQQGDVTVHALAGVSLTIECGEFVSLCGPSGSGKTTLLNCVAGLDIPTSGEVYLIGNKISSMSKTELADLRLNNVGFVFQAYNLVPVLSAQENVEFVMELQGMSKKLRGEKARSVLREVGLEGMEHRRPAELSGGQQQRVAVARAIASEPQLVLADEPTANLDSKTSASLMDIMRKMNEDHGITFVFSTHDQLVMDRARRLVRMHDGLIESDEIQS